MTSARLIVVRHGVTDWNREGRFQGHLDPPLAEAGQHEARLVAARLTTDAQLRPARVISSSLARAMQTAAAIAEAAAVEVEPDTRLIEIGQGEWEGRTHAELEADDHDRYQAWRHAPGVRQPPGGESIASASARVGELLGELEASDGPWPICLVSHGGTLRIAAQLLLDLGGDHSWALDVDNASVGVVTRSTTGWSLDRWNDTLHLLGLEPTHVDEEDGRPLAL